MQQARLPDGPDLYLVPNPGSALLGNLLLFQAVLQGQALVFNFEGFFIRFFRVQGGNKAGLTKEEIKALDVQQVVLQRIKGINREVG